MSLPAFFPSNLSAGCYKECKRQVEGAPDNLSWFRIEREEVEILKVREFNFFFFNSVLWWRYWKTPAHSNTHAHKSTNTHRGPHIRCPKYCMWFSFGERGRWREQKAGKESSLKAQRLMTSSHGKWLSYCSRIALSWRAMCTCSDLNHRHSWRARPFGRSWRGHVST